MRHFWADTREGGEPSKGARNFTGELIPDDNSGFLDVLGFTVVEADLVENYVR